MKTKKNQKRKVRDLSQSELKSIYGGIDYKVVIIDGKRIIVKIG